MAEHITAAILSQGKGRRVEGTVGEQDELDPGLSHGVSCTLRADDDIQPADSQRYVDFMTLTPAQRDQWRHSWERESEALDQRRGQLRQAAHAVANALRQRWPGVVVRLFGSVLGPGFHAGSDLDLAVEGLPAQGQLEALALAEDETDLALARLGGEPVAVDLVRLEALPEPWRERIRLQGQVLSAGP